MFGKNGSDETNISADILLVNKNVISQNEVFGDIMVLASPLADPDDVNALKSKNILRISFIFYMRVE